jgi:uncharacterized membrane protein
VPIAGVLVAIAQTGNPLIAGAVRAIAIAGLAIAWCSGAVLDAVRARRGRIGVSRAALHVLALVVAVAGAVFLALDRDRVIDVVIETWHEGPSAR